MIRKTPIKLIKKLCKGCGNETYLFSKGFCKQCTMRKGKKLTPSKSLKSKPKLEKEKDIELMTYFEKHIEALKSFGVSEESGSPIPYPTNINICHLLDKARHPSVATHLDNCIYLTWEEHSQFDNLLFQHRFQDVRNSFPNSWETVVSRLKIIIPLCKERTKYLVALEEFIQLT